MFRMCIINIEKKAWQECWHLQSDNYVYMPSVRKCSHLAHLFHFFSLYHFQWSHSITLNDVSFGNIIYLHSVLAWAFYFKAYFFLLLLLIDIHIFDGSAHCLNEFRKFYTLIQLKMVSMRRFFFRSSEHRFTCQFWCLFDFLIPICDGKNGKFNEKCAPMKYDFFSFAQMIFFLCYHLTVWTKVQEINVCGAALHKSFNISSWYIWHSISIFFFAQHVEMEKNVSILSKEISKLERYFFSRFFIFLFG